MVHIHSYWCIIITTGIAAGHSWLLVNIATYTCPYYTGDTTIVESTVLLRDNVANTCNFNSNNEFA